MDARKTADRIVQWLQEHKEQANAKGFVVGLSGGVDSAVAAALAKLACPDGMLAIIMPCYSDPQDAKDAMLTAEALQIPVKTVDLGPVYDALFAQANLDPEGSALAGSSQCEAPIANGHRVLARGSVKLPGGGRRKQG